RTSIVITNDQGVALHKVDLDLATANPATFLADLNAQLGTNGSASFVDGRLKIEGATGTGVVVVDDPAAPTNKGGRGFSHCFVPNERISTDPSSMYEAGTPRASRADSAPRETSTSRFSDPAGPQPRDGQGAGPAGGDITSLLPASIDPLLGAVGVGPFRP